MDARNLPRPTSRRTTRARGLLLQPPPRPATDARLTRFTALLDTLSAGECALATARTEVERGNPAQAERELTQFISRARPVLEHSKDLPSEYVELLGQCLGRCLVARAASRVEQSFEVMPRGGLLRDAARLDIRQASELPPAWLDARTRTSLGRLQRVLETAHAP